MNRVKTDLTDNEGETVTEDDILTESSTDSDCNKLSQSKCESNTNCKYLKIKGSETRKKFLFMYLQRMTVINILG